MEMKNTQLRKIGGIIMESKKLKATLMILENTGRFTKTFLKNKRELTEQEIAYLINEEYIILCGTNAVNEKLYCISQKGKEFWRNM